MICQIRYSLIVLLFICFNLSAKNIWVSDEIQAPLRKTPDINADISKLIDAGSQVEVLSSQDEYIKIKTQSGDIGWLSKYYVLDKESVHVKYDKVALKAKQLESELKKVSQILAEKKQQLLTLTDSLDEKGSHLEKLEKVTAADQKSKQQLSKDNELLKTKLLEQNKKITELAAALKKANMQAVDARTDYLSLAKSSDNLVEIVKRNKETQERILKIEQDFQLVKNENQTLKSQQVNRNRIIGVLIVLAGIFIGYLIFGVRAKHKQSYY